MIRDSGLLFLGHPVLFNELRYSLSDCS